MNWEEFLCSNAQLRLSLVAEEAGKCVGAYLLRRCKIRDVERYPDIEWEPGVDVSDFDRKKGIEGMALFVDPDRQGDGIGRHMINHMEAMALSKGFDYICGRHFDFLDSLSMWEERRDVVAKAPRSRIVVTAKELR